MRNISVIFALVMFTPVPSVWAADDMRFQLEKIEDGFIRLDRQTGQVSVCREEGKEMICRISADEKAAYDLGLAALEDRIAKLEAKVAPPEFDPAAKTPDGFPTDEEFEKSLGFMEKFFRRFMGIVRELENSEKTGHLPDRT